MIEARFRPGDVVQITDPKHDFFPCLLTVEEVKTWGVQGYIMVPANKEGEPLRWGRAYLRPRNEEITLVGVAAVVGEEIPVESEGGEM